MKTNSTQNKEVLKKLAGYTASAGALIALSSVASGQITYSGEENTVFESSPDINPIDLDGDGIDDFILGHQTIATTNVGTAATVYFNVGMAAVNNARTDTYNSFLLGFSTLPSMYLADALASDEVISSGQNPWYHSGSGGILDFGYYVTALVGTVTTTTYFLQLGQKLFGKGRIFFHFIRLRHKL